MGSWSTRYIPPSLRPWQGRPDSPPGACFYQIMQLLDLDAEIPAIQNKLAFGLLGFCCDEGIKRNLGRIGASEGPRALRLQLSRLPLHKLHFLCYDAGDITCTDGDLESAQIALGNAVNRLLEANITPIVIGGGHELAWGHYQGLAKKFLNESIAIINFDAHFDMRPLLPNGDGSSGTPFLQIAQAHHVLKRKFDYNCIGIQHAGNTRQLFETAKKHNTEIILADDLHQGFMDKCVNFVDRIIDQSQAIYLSLCMDVFAHAYAPGVSAPQTLGLAPWQIIPLIRQLAGSGKVISYDIAELSPNLDPDERTAKLAANLVYEIIHHHTKQVTI
jgi:formiminoglutamase